MGKAVGGGGGGGEGERGGGGEGGGGGGGGVERQIENQTTTRSRIPPLAKTWTAIL